MVVVVVVVSEAGVLFEAGLLWEEGFEVKEKRGEREREWKIPLLNPENRERRREGNGRDRTKFRAGKFRLSNRPAIVSKAKANRHLHTVPLN